MILNVDTRFFFFFLFIFLRQMPGFVLKGDAV